MPWNRFLGSRTGLLSGVMCFRYSPSFRALRRSSPVADMIVAAESRRGPSPLRGPGDNKLCKGLQGSSGPPEPRDGEGVRVPG